MSGERFSLDRVRQARPRTATLLPNQTVYPPPRRVTVDAKCTDGGGARGVDRSRRSTEQIASRKAAHPILGSSGPSWLLPGPEGFGSRVGIRLTCPRPGFFYAPIVPANQTSSRDQPHTISDATRRVVAGHWQARLESLKSLASRIYSDWVVASPILGHSLSHSF